MYRKEGPTALGGEPLLAPSHAARYASVSFATASA